MPTFAGTINAETFRGTTAGDVINAAGGDDVVTGGGGADTIDAGPGNDRIIWNMGDGSDVVEGGDGVDEQFLVGTAGADSFTLTASGSHVMAAAGSALLDIHGVEEVSIQSLGGADNIQIGDLSATDVRTLVIDVGAADGQADTVSVAGTGINDVISVQISGASALRVQDSSGFGLTTTNLASLGAEDRLVVDGGLGNDLITVSTAKGVTLAGALTEHGGDGNDTLIGSAGGDILQGDAGADVISGGDGDDRIIWNAGDGIDTADGGAGFDTQVINGASGGHTIVLGPNTFTLGHALVTVDGTMAVDLVNVEQVVVDAGDGNDTIQVGKLKAVGVSAVTVDAGAGDDSLQAALAPETLMGGLGNDTIAGGGGGDSLAGGAGNDTILLDDLSARPIFGFGGLGDTIDGGAGQDTLQVTSRFGASAIEFSASDNHVQATFDGAPAADIVGIETINVAAGMANTVLIDDLSATDVQTVNVALPTGQFGLPDHAPQTVMVSGSSAGDTVTVTVGGSSGNAPGPLTFAATIHGVTETINVKNWDLTDTVGFQGGDGNDTLTGPSFGSVALLGGGGNDVISGGRLVDGGVGDDTLSAMVTGTISGGDGNDVIQGDDLQLIDGGAGNDLIHPGFDGDTILGGAGDDTISGDNLSFFTNFVNVDGGDGNDLIVGTGGNDTLAGGAGFDTLTGGNGNDSISGGSHDLINPGDGADVILWTQDPNDLSSSPMIDAGAGNDTFIFAPSSGAKVAGVTALGSQGLFFSVDGATLLNVRNVESIAFAPTGPTEIQLNDLTGSLIRNVEVDLSHGHGASLDFGGVAQFPEQVTVKAGANPGEFFLTETTAGFTPQATTTHVEGLDASNTVTIDMGGGNDTIFLQTITSSAHFVIEGGPGNDIIEGPGGSNSTVIWNAGDGSDDIENVGSGVFNGAAKGSTVLVTDNGGVVSVSVDGTTSTFIGIPDLQLNGQSGNDTIIVGDLTDHFVSSTMEINGGAGNDRIAAGVGVLKLTTIDGGDGSDTLSGAAGPVEFVFHATDSGSDVVTDFVARSNETIDLVGFADHSFADLVAHGHLVQSGANVLVTDGTHTIVTLQNIGVGNLGASDFLFG